jgi:ectoine hydroxylase-related dioxygenase (phytanoyl-CoA dioxygenase family)
MMKTNYKTLNKNIKKHRHFLKKNGYLVVTNILNKKNLENMEKLILNTAKIYINFNKKKISGLDDPYFNKELIKLRKKSKKKFAYFFDTLQTSIASYQLWTNTKIMKIVKKIMACEIDTISATDLLVRIDSPIDIRNKLEWHQDSAYFRQNNKGYNGLNCWTPLTKLTFNMGPLEFLEKSHKLGLVKVKKKRPGKFRSLQRKIDPKLIKNLEIKKFELNLGDFIFLNMDTVHRSGENTSKIFRMSSICRYHKTNSKDFNPGLNIYKYSNKNLNKEVHGF